MLSNQQQILDLNPLVSVVICTYNGERFLWDTLKSVFSQTYTNLEIVIVDDGSTDGTRTILEKTKKLDNRVKVFLLERNKGLAEARNYAFQNATGIWIAIIDQDDLCYPSRIERQVLLSLKNPDADLIFCNTHYIDENGLITGDHLSPFHIPAEHIDKGVAANLLLRYGCFIDSESVFLRGSIVEKYGKLDKSLRHACDYEYFIRIGLSSSFAYTNEILAAWRIHRNQFTQVYKIKDKNIELIRIYFRYFWNPSISFITRLSVLYSTIKVIVHIFYFLVRNPNL